MVPLVTLPLAPLVTIGTIVPLATKEPWTVLAANGANVTIGRANGANSTIGRSNATIGKNIGQWTIYKTTYLLAHA